MNDVSRPVAIGGPRFRVNVTQRDIDWGVRGDSGRCMVAKAIAREFNDAHRIEVDTQTIRFSTPEARYAYLTPLTVQQYVAAFDAGDPIEPFNFWLRNPMRMRRQLMTAEGKAAERLARLTEEKVPSPVKAGKKGPGQHMVREQVPGGIPRPPRVFRTGKRTYGQRRLRINQPMAAMKSGVVVGHE